MYSTTNRPELLIQCEGCGADVFADDVVEGPNGEQFCEDCHDERVVQCEGCGADVLDEDVIEGPDGKCYCEHCCSKRFKECAGCEGYFARKKMVNGPDGEVYCRECWLALFGTCGLCGQAIDLPSDWSSDCGDYTHLCDRCASDVERYYDDYETDWDEEDW